ncbi:hypothetical protein AB431_17630 [Mycobacterium sp. EPa45]|nr:hypothetical protein AB431_17630 [Mycobacterium sp. EPa45]
MVGSPGDVAPTLAGPGTLRWASGQPVGPRSMTWQVIGARNSDDIYVGARGLMHDMKLSLHMSRVWRWAFTQQALQKYFPPGADSKVIRYEESAPFADGWRRGAVIRTPSTTFGPAYSEKRPSDKQPIRFFTAPDPPQHWQYHVLIAEPAAPPIQIPVVFVGSMVLTSGKTVCVVADHWEMTTEREQSIAQAIGAAAEEPRARAGIASGDIGGVPLLIDLARLRPEDGEHADAGGG